MLINIPTLHGRWVELEPLAEAHREELRPAAEDARIWTHALSVATGDGFDRWFNDTVRERDADSRIPFAVRQRLVQHRRRGMAYGAIGSGETIDRIGCHLNDH